MSHLLRIDSSIRVEGSVTRASSARAAEVWRAAHSGGTGVGLPLYLWTSAAMAA